MNNFSLSHLSDAALDCGLESAARDESGATARLLAHLAESDARRRYAEAGHESMKAYCVRGLRFSEDAAEKRIRVARTARQFPLVFSALADRRLHLTAVLMLAPHLNPQNAEELLAAATHRSKPEVELLLAARFPRPDLPERVETLAAQLGTGEPALERVGELSTATGERPCEPVTERPKVTALSPQRFGYQFTGDQTFHDDLERFRSLLGHQGGSSNVVETIHHAIRLGIRQLEKRKCGTTDRPRTRRSHPSTNSRHIPAEVRRAVWARDGGRCTFVSDSGRRCEARDRLEFDHAEPVARGGGATVGNIRLRCRTHNQLEAERAYGAEFMKSKRAAASVTAAERAGTAVAERARAESESTQAEELARARAQAVEEVIPWLRALGLRADESRHAAALCERIPDAPLEQRVRLALTCFARPGRGRVEGLPQHAS